MPNQTYGSTSGPPSSAAGQQVLYFLTLEEYNRYGVLSVTATILFWHTALCIDLIATFTTKGANPGQSVTLNKLNISYGSTQGTWCELGGYTGVLPTGSPF